MKTIAIITGAASGLGKEFTKQINIDHVDEIWAIDYNKADIEKYAKEIVTPIKIIDGDLSTNKPFTLLEHELEKEKPNVKWLINCAGFAKFGDFNDIDLKDNLSMIDVNCKAVVWLTQLVIPYMTEYSKILNVASVAAFQPIPYINVYAATKAFVLRFSRALAQELKRKKINVTCVCPFWTKTKFFDKVNIKNKEIVSYYCCMYDPVLVVKQALKDAIKKKQSSIYGYKSKLQHFLAKILPHRFIMWVWQKQQKLFKKYPIKKGK